MANAPQMKIPIGADTSDFDKGARKVKQEMKDLEKVSGDAFGAIGAALGVDTTKLNQFSSALSGLGQKLQAAGTEGTKAFGAILTAIGPIAGAVAGIGLAAATTAFKVLNEEAENFKSTIAGANIELATTAYIQTYKQVLHDINVEIGKTMAETESKMDKATGTAWAKITQFFISGAFGNLVTLGTPYGSTAGLDAYGKSLEKAEGAASRAEELTKEIFDLERKRAANMERVSELSYKIAEQERIAREALAAGDVVAAQNAISRARGYITERSRIQLQIEEKISNKMKERVGLAGSTIEEQDAAYAQSMKVFSIKQQEEQQLNTLVRLEKSVSGETTKQATALERSAAAGRELAASMAQILDTYTVGLPGGLDVDTDLTKPIVARAEVQYPEDGVLRNAGEHMGQQIAEGMKIKVADISGEIEGLVTDMAAKLGDILGTLVADLSNGENAWQNFESAAVNAFADMAAAVGKIAIEAGTASLGIQAALKLSPTGAYMAIAAGVALVALSAYAKQSLANVSAGNYAAGAGIVTSSSTSAGAYDYEQRDVYVNVTGTLTAEGDELVAVINNTKKKNLLTT